MTMPPPDLNWLKTAAREIAFGRSDAVDQERLQTLDALESAALSGLVRFYGNDLVADKLMDLALTRRNFDVFTATEARGDDADEGEEE